jgi:ABC-type branched-subunit amino acid transport system substrate-binding protein
MRILRKFILVFIILISYYSAFAQEQPKVWKVAVFAPVYLDSAYTQDGNYRLGNQILPRYMMPGLDFYNGIMLAVDSLNAEKMPIEVVFYDSKSMKGSTQNVILDSSLAEVSLIIASFNNRNEIKPLADFALEHEIPLISATYPNDAGLTENPYFILINPTLRTHLEGIYSYLQRVYPTSTMTMFRRKGVVEDMIQNSFAEIARSSTSVPLKIKTVELTDSFTTSQVISYLDSSRQNIVICGTLNEAFGINLVKSLSESKKYRSIAIGTPTWDALRGIDRNVEIVYTTPYHFIRTDKIGLDITNTYRNKFSGRPSDMVFKGFEAMYRFTKLLIKHEGSLMKNLSDKSLKLFNEFDLQPVKPYSNNPNAVDYLENKKLYFIRKMDGQIRSVN